MNEDLQPKVLVAVPAETLAEGDWLVIFGTKRGGGEITSVFNTGHGRVQIEVDGVKSWLNTDDHVVVLRVFG